MDFRITGWRKWIYEQGKIIDRLSQSEIHLGKVVRQQGIAIDRMQGQLAKYEANRGSIVDWAEREGSHRRAGGEEESTSS